MSPPAEPESETVQVTFVDIPAALRVSETFTPLVTSYPDFLSLLNALSGPFIYKLDNPSQPHVHGQGLVLSDGGWWYRLVKPTKDVITEAGVHEAMPEKGPWTLLDCPFGYEKMVGELCLGVKWRGACIEVQRNQRKKRDEVGSSQADANGIKSPIFQHAAPQYHHNYDSEPAEVNDAMQAQPQSTEQHDKVSVVRGLQSDYDARIGASQSHRLGDAGLPNDFIGVHGGSSPRADKGNSGRKLTEKYPLPLIVCSPFVGVVPPDDDDDDDERDDVTPKCTPSTPVANPSSSIVTEPIVAHLSSELVKGPAGITYLPAYHNRASEPPLEVAFNPPLVSGPPPRVEAEFYPPPPRATGSPNDRYRQVPRSGGAIRNPDYKPYQYQCGGSYHQLGGGASSSAFRHQQQLLFPYQNPDQSQCHSPATTVQQSENFWNQSHLPGPHQCQPCDQQSPLRGSYRYRVRGKYDVRKVRGRCHKKNESARGYNSSRYQYGAPASDPDNSPRLPLDPALEVNYRKDSRQHKYHTGQGQYSNQNNTHGENHFQNHYTGYGNGYGDGDGDGDDKAYQDSYPAPPTSSSKSNYYLPSQFVAQRGEAMLSLRSETEMIGPAQRIAATTQEQPRQPFIPSPFAPTFVPRSNALRQEHTEQDQAQAKAEVQDSNGGGASHATAGDAGTFQYQLQNYSMLPGVPGPFIGTTPIPTAAALMSQPVPLLPYQRPKPFIPMPPMGHFSPPKARKNRKQAKRVLEKAFASGATEVVDAAPIAAAAKVGRGQEHVVDNVDELDDDDDDDDDDDGGGGGGGDGDGGYTPPNEGKKKKYRKLKKPRNKRRAVQSVGAKDKEQANEDGGDSQRRMEDLTATVAPAVDPGITTPAAEAEAQLGIEEDERMAEG